MKAPCGPLCSGTTPASNLLESGSRGSIPPTSQAAANTVRRIAVCFLRGLIRLYQLTLSPFIGGQCRFHPTCSNYALEAIDRHGPVTGSWLALRRLLKCHPFHPGGLDLPPRSGD